MLISTPKTLIIVLNWKNMSSAITNGGAAVRTVRCSNVVWCVCAVQNLRHIAKKNWTKTKKDLIFFFFLNAWMGWELQDHSLVNIPKKTGFIFTRFSAPHSVRVWLTFANTACENQRFSFSHQSISWLQLHLSSGCNLTPTTGCATWLFVEATSYNLPGWPCDKPGSGSLLMRSQHDQTSASSQQTCCFVLRWSFTELHLLKSLCPAHSF